MSNTVLFLTTELFYSKSVDSHKTVTIQGEPNQTHNYVFTNRSRWPRGLRLRPTVSLSCWVWGFESCRSMEISLLWVLCVVKYRSLRRADHSSKGVLLSVVCLSVIHKPHRGGLGPTRAVEAWKKSPKTNQKSARRYSYQLQDLLW
jgi:hypothetical protein